jgi:ATP-dependent DNA helicase RecQ
LDEVKCVAILIFLGMETTHPTPPVPSGHEEVADYVFTTQPRIWQKKLKDYARHNRHQPTGAEACLWQALRNSRLAAKFRRQHAIEAYIVDFICISARLTIELDGEIHNAPEHLEYDAGRTFMLKELGYRELRFTNSQVLTQLPQVLATIKEHLQNTPCITSPPGPLSAGEGAGG